MCDILKRAPYAHEQSGYTNTMDLEESGLRVVSIAYANNEDGSEGLKSSAVACAAFVNGNGEMEEYIGVRNINVKLYRDKVSDLTPNTELFNFKSHTFLLSMKRARFLVSKSPLCPSTKDSTSGLQFPTLFCFLFRKFALSESKPLRYFTIFTDFYRTVVFHHLANFKSTSSIF